MIGALVVVPAGLLASMMGKPTPSHATDTQASAARARAVVMALERGLGFEPTDREFEKLGYDIESRVPGTGKLRFIEVKGRTSDADSITVTRNEVLTALNKPEDFILAIVRFDEDGGHEGALRARAVPQRAGLWGGERELPGGGAVGAGRRALLGGPANIDAHVREIADVPGQDGKPIRRWRRKRGEAPPAGVRCRRREAMKLQEGHAVVS